MAAGARGRRRGGGRGVRGVRACGRASGRAGRRAWEAFQMAWPQARWWRKARSYEGSARMSGLLEAFCAGVGGGSETGGRALSRHP